MKNKQREIVLPALRGVMGDWVYYSCLMDLGELSQRVHYAEEIHPNKAFAEMIQSQIQKGRGAQIAEYVKKQPDRFFNSLVIATYGGQPSWHGISNIRNNANAPELEDLQEEIVASVGFLALRGDEKLFALDGQHRLAGIKKAVKDGAESDPYDEVSVIFVEHKDTDDGRRRTRRLFTTLNKTARPVSKCGIIALDKEDIMAICARRLIDETELFSGDRIAFVAGNKLPMDNSTSLTTIGNLYDLITILFTNARSTLQAKESDLQRIRPDDDRLDEYFEFSREYFVLLMNGFNELGEFFSASETGPIVRKYRNSHGGNALYRPVGLEVFTHVVARLSQELDIAESVKQAARLPRILTDEPFRWLMWDPDRETMLNTHKVTLREVLLYILGRNSSKYPENILLERYRRETGDVNAKLPEKLV